MAGAHVEKFSMSDQIISGDKVGIGTTTSLAALTVRPTAPFQLTGTLATTEGSTTVTGTGTLFLSELAVGDSIDLSDTMDPYKSVVAIASDTSLTVATNYNTDQSGTAVTAYPSTLRLDDGSGNPQLVFTNLGNMGIGTMQPNAALDISGTGAGYWRGCDVSLRVHTPEYQASWQIVMSTDAGGPDAGVAMWMNDHGDGTSALVFTLIDAQDDELDALMIDGTGLTVAGGLAITPTQIASAYTLQLSDYYVYAQSDVADYTVTLPAISGCPGKVFHVFKTAGSGPGNIIIAPTGTDTINGVNASKTITVDYSGVTIVAVQTDWVMHALPAI
jgi:hypothetical protein